MQDQIRQLGQELRDSATSAIGLPRASREVTRAIIAQGLAARRYRIQQELQVRREHAMSPFAVATATAAAEATNHETTVPWPQGTGDDRKMHGQATTTCVIDELPLQPRHGDTRAAGSDEDEAWTHIDPWQLSLPFEHMPGDNRDDGDESKAINNGTLTPSHDIVDRSGGGDSTLCTTTCSTVVIDGVPPGSSPGTIQHHDDLYQEQLTSERTQQRISSSSVHRDPTETTAVAALDSVMDWPQQHIPAKANHRYPGRVLPEGIKRPQKQPQLIHDKQSTSATVFQSSVDHKTEEASEVTIFEIDDEDEHGLLGLVRSGGLLSGEMALLDNFDSFERELNECLSE
ncbi:hypothetical protein BGZ73_004335 [Actinomortierella ambigua]|nr:hypothetical protein BGZ73_004335 [Actinomortierella ambigua]